jgi:hypothetical protein
MTDFDEQQDGKEVPIGTPKQMELTTRIGFFIGLSVMLIILFMYIRSIGSEHETWMLLNFLVVLGLTIGMGYIWRRRYWMMRRAALEDGFD